MNVRDERIEAVINNLSSLIYYHSTLTAHEQYSPGQNPDSSDELIEEHKKWIKELREIREKFENLVTGLI
jgi:hypothetical protein